MNTNRSRLRAGLVLAIVALVAGACTTPSVNNTVDVGITTATSSTTTTTTPPTTTTTSGPNPLTDRPIDPELLSLMPLDGFTTSLPGYAVEVFRNEDNEVAVQRLPSGSDEREDIRRYGRINGYRTVLRPARFTSDNALAVDSWVVVFETDAGAAGYLKDFAADVVKGEDAGHGADLRVLEANDFLVEEVGEEAIGLVLSEQTVYGYAGFEETLIGFRLGRLLGFVSVLRGTEGDYRIPTLFAAQELEQRIRAVLDGSIVRVAEPEPALLAAYRFTYSQSLAESYLKVVYPDLPPDVDDGTDDGTAPPGGDDEPPPDDGDEPPPTDDGSTTSSTTTTTTTLLVPTTDITTIDSGGVILDPGGLDCTVRIGSDFGRERNHIILFGTQAWRSVLTGAEEMFDVVDPEEEPTASDLIYCPGWNPSMSVSGIDLVVTPGFGEMVEWPDGSTAEKFDLGVEALSALGIVPEGGGGITVDEFVVYLGGDAPWVVGIDLSFRGSTAEMERALGPGFRTGADIVITVDFRITDINSPEITVVPPDPATVAPDPDR